MNNTKHTIEVELEGGDKIKIDVTFKCHRSFETLICETTLADGKPLKLPVELKPPNKTRKYWDCKCGIWQTGAHEKDENSRVRWATGISLFKQNVEVFNSMIERAKFISVDVMVPKDGGCHKCPLLGEKSWRDGGTEELVREPYCNYLDKIITDTDVKHKECPAIGKEW